METYTCKDSPVQVSFSVHYPKRETGGDLTLLLFDTLRECLQSEQNVMTASQNLDLAFFQSPQQEWGSQTQNHCELQELRKENKTFSFIFTCTQFV